MRRDTTERLRELNSEDLTLDERMARAAEQAAEREAERHEKAGHIINAPTLPSNTTTDLVTVTVDELHDLVYSSVSNVLRRTSMTIGRAQQVAARAAIEGQQIARANGWTVRGTDPRPAAER